MKHQISYSIRPKEPGDEKKNHINEENVIPSFNLDDFKRYPGKETPRKPKDLLKKLAVIGGGVTVGLIFGYALLQTFINPGDINKAGQVTQPIKSTVVSTNDKEMSISLNEINVFWYKPGCLPLRKVLIGRQLNLKINNSLLKSSRRMENILFMLGLLLQGTKHCLLPNFIDQKIFQS